MDANRDEIEKARADMEKFFEGWVQPTCRCVPFWIEPAPCPPSLAAFFAELSAREGQS